MSSYRTRRPITYNYLLKGVSIDVISTANDLSITCDQDHNFHNHIKNLAIKHLRHLVL
jgi:hypothetical protein